MKKQEQITASITFILGVWIMFYAWHTLKLGSIHVPDAGLLPFLCGFGLTVLGVAWIIVLRGAEERVIKGDNEERLWFRPLLSIALMVIYGWAMESIGYLTSTLIFVTAWQKIIEREKWVKTIILAVIGTASMYALFVYLLKVPIPPDFFNR